MFNIVQAAKIRIRMEASAAALADFAHGAASVADAAHAHIQHVERLLAGRRAEVRTNELSQFPELFKHQ
jgi:hypothetical protein